MPPMPELSVLKPLDPSITNEDDYPDFPLSEVRVVCASNGQPASLLAAYADTPLIVEGRLGAPKRENGRYLIKKPFKPLDIKITDVTRYSYGQSTTGGTLIWALGQCGWFELRPSRAYKDIFAEMVEAVQILYFMTDIYNEPRKRGGGPSASLLYQEYAEDERFGCKSVEEAESRFWKHRETLIMWFLSKAQGISWGGTSVYRQFKSLFPKEFEAAKARVDGRVEASVPADPSGLSTTSAVPQRSRGRGAAKAKPQQTSDPGKPDKDQNWWEATALFEFMQKAINHRAMRIGHITLSKVASLLVLRYEISSPEIAENVLRVHAKNLRYMMDHPRRKSIRFFKEERIYRELGEEGALSAVEVRRAEGVELKPRKDRATLKEDESESDSSTEDSDTVAAKTPKRRSPSKKARLSTLRPKSSKFSGKGKGKGKKAPGARMRTGSDSASDAEEDEVSETTENENGDENEGDMEIDTFTHLQALSPTGLKRKLNSTTDTDDEHVHGTPKPRKRGTSHPISPNIKLDAESSDPSDRSSPQSSSSASDEIDTNLRIPTDPLPLRLTNPNTKATSAATALLPPIISTPLPSYTANAPGDTWICPFDGCAAKIYAVSEETGRRLVSEHLQRHQDAASVNHRNLGAGGGLDLVDVVLGEGGRVGLPVNNLLRRIREMAEGHTSLFLGLGGRPTPKAVERSV
ncbi:hypothetical protein BCR34DRAFT_506208 [Clohesyomyces aquaticus]|uniref:DNA (cytosine-5)-methyltransferase 1 replication foci domain-containing protein n=1 Tax=Clohesyomyces aquaticus TaxID=1231657 RepID=A0A1Y2A4U6_9PLEO|nr:hypothetical protein BCR34DRAFT_506208 [Clohesyomyces aquaticus]